MAVDFDAFKPAKTFLVCVDSDGCAMDSMTIKHVECFGPCMVDVYGMDDIREQVLDIWNRVNLYSMTRGINRFLGLMTTLDILEEKNLWHCDCADLKKWTKESDELSENSLKRQIEAVPSKALEKALIWSQETNRSIKALPREKNRPFEGAAEGLEAASRSADVVIVSSANRQAVLEEWEYYGLMDSVSVVMTQELGSKAACIAKLLNLGYEKDHVLMVGDAPGDLASANKNGVRYYPILVGREKESWETFRNTVLEQFIRGDYDNNAMAQWVTEFEDNLTKGSK